MEPIMKALSLVVSATLLLPTAAAAELNVLMSGGFSSAYEQVLPEFERTTGIKVKTGSGASQGTGPQTIPAQLARGVSADMVILSREGLDDLIAKSRIAKGTDVDLARVGLGVGIKAGTAKPDVTTVEAFKQLVLGSKLVVAPGSTSGIWITKELFPKLGLADKVTFKLTPRGTDATGMVAAGTADITVQPVSEILPAAGVEFAGSLAPEIQFIQTFSAAVIAGSGEAEAAKKLIAFLASPNAAAAIKKSGMEQVGKAR
jgi:molybdate transport system substrate-binding protein